MTGTPSTVPDERDTPPWYYRRNAIAFGTDMALFHAAMSFFSSTAVLPSFLAALTDSEVVVGLASGVSTGAWLLPQLFVASLVARLPRKKPFVIGAVWVARPVLLLMALTVWLFGAEAPTATLVVTIVGIAVFFAGDAFAAVPWFDLVGKALPTRRRGRVLGAGQVIGGLGGIGVGAIVRYVLGPNSLWAFPTNYAVLFAMGGGTFIIASLVLFLIHEPEAETVEREVVPVREVMASIPRILRQDRAFVRLIVVRLLVSFVGVASAFYVLYATRRLGFRQEDAGLFISAQVAGSMGAGLLLSTAQDRWGPLLHMRLVLILALVPPVLTLLAGPLHALHAGILAPLYLAIYFFLGLYTGGLGWPFFNWILEYAREDRRALYIGLINTLSSLAMVAPALGGWTVAAISYPAVFGLALVFAIAALVLSRTIPDTRASEA